MGVALGLIGSRSSYSADGVKGNTLAVEVINAKGGFLGKYPIKLRIRDTQTKPEVGVKEAKDLIMSTYFSYKTLADKGFLQVEK